MQISRRLVGIGLIVVSYIIGVGSAQAGWEVRATAYLDTPGKPIGLSMGGLSPVSAPMAPVVVALVVLGLLVAAGAAGAKRESRGGIWPRVRER